MAPRTQPSSLAAVHGVAQYSHQPLDTISESQLHAHLRYLIAQRHCAPSSVRVTVMGLRVFSTHPLQRPFANLPLPTRAKTVPVVFSREEVARLLASTVSLRERALLMTTYGGGRRVSEVVRLRVSDLEAQRALVRIEQGKGRKDRYPLLGPRLLATLRPYRQGYRPVQPWLFPQRRQPQPRDPATAQQVYYGVTRRAGITKAGGIQALRPAFATHGVEGGRDLATLPQLLGHDRITTMRYVHGARPQAAAQGSPRESLPDLFSPR